MKKSSSRVITTRWHTHFIFKTANIRAEIHWGDQYIGYGIIIIVMKIRLTFIEMLIRTVQKLEEIFLSRLSPFPLSSIPQKNFFVRVLYRSTRVCKYQKNPHTNL